MICSGRHCSRPFALHRTKVQSSIGHITFIFVAFTRMNEEQVPSHWSVGHQWAVVRFRTRLIARDLQFIALLALAVAAQSKASGLSSNGAAFDDSHFHITNCIQEGTDIREVIGLMGNPVARSTLVGIPLQQQWSYRNMGDSAPTYYLDSDARDHIRRELQTFPVESTGNGEFTIHKESVSSKMNYRACGVARVKAALTLSADDLTAGGAQTSSG
jgi:hypothetical protein